MLNQFVHITADLEQMIEKGSPDEQSAEDGEASNVPSAASPSTSNAADQEIKNLKAILAQQTRQLSSLTKTVEQLTSEVKSLKAS